MITFMKVPKYKIFATNMLDWSIRSSQVVKIWRADRSDWADLHLQNGFQVLHLNIAHACNIINLKSIGRKGGFIQLLKDQTCYVQQKCCTSKLVKTCRATALQWYAATHFSTHHCRTRTEYFTPISSDPCLLWQRLTTWRWRSVSDH